MNVKIGPYINYIGPYQLAEMILFWIPKYDENFSINKKYDKYVYKFGEYLAKIDWLSNLCQWIYDKRKRTIKVHIDEYDVWSADHTLAYIILPVLKKLKSIKHSSQEVDIEDVPEYLRYTNTEEYESQLTFDFYRQENTQKIMCDVHSRWDFVLDEMIFAFEHILNDDWHNNYKTERPMTEEEKQNKSSIEKLINNDMHVEWDWDSIKKIDDRIKNGLRLFGKYYQGLWD